MNLLLLPLTLVLLYHCQQTKADCRKPSPSPNVLIAYPKGQDGRKPLKEFTMLQLRCAKGYKPSKGGDSFIICLNNRWRVSEDDKTRLARLFYCEKKKCPVKKPKNGIAKLRGNEVTYVCNTGFSLVGSQTALCKLDENDDYFVTEEPPECKERKLHCEKPHVPNLIYDEDCCSKNKVYRFRCGKNYYLSGEHILTCDENSTWSGPLPSCQPLEKCEDPGTPAFSTRKGECCDASLVIEYNCIEGYELLHKHERYIMICLSHGTWSRIRPTCKPIGKIPCEIDLSKNNLVIESSSRQHPDLFLPGDVVDFNCLKHYVSTNKTFSLICEENGLWDSEIPSCVAANPCTRPRNPRNGRILELENNNADKFEPGYEINFECDKGFRITNGSYFSTCIASKWDNFIPDCIPIKCGNPGFITNALRTGNEFEVGKNVTYTCMSGMKLIGLSVRVCQENGRWTEGITACSSEVNDNGCLDPGIPINGYRQGDKFNIGDTVVYSCKPRHTLFGDTIRKCLDNRVWSGKEVQCIGENEYSNYEDVANSLQKIITEVVRVAKYPPINGGVNLIFLLDVSKSISHMHFNQSKEFIKLVIKKASISSHANGVRAAVLTFSSEVKEIFVENVEDDKSAFNAIDSIEFDKRGTNIYRAYLKAGIILSLIRKDVRKNSQTIIFLISDGIITEGGIPTDIIATLSKRYGCKFYTMAIGRVQDTAKLAKISDEVFTFGNNKMIKIVDAAIGKKIDFSLCGMERPMYNFEAVIGGDKTRYSSAARIDGKHSAKGTWPWMVAFKLHSSRNTNSVLAKYNLPIDYHCGGVIIHTKWILSAAHCFHNRNQELHQVMNQPRNWKLLVGRTSESLSSALEYSIKMFKVHPFYKFAETDYDITLVQISSDLTYDYFTRSICLPPIYEELSKDSALYAPKEYATVIGWKYNDTVTLNDTYTPNSLDEYLNEVDVPIQAPHVCQRTTSCTNGICNERNTRHQTAKMLCAGNGLGHIDACTGYSGESLMQQVLSEEKSNITIGKGYRWFSIGIASWDVGCEQKDHYGYYVHVSKLRKWINNVTNVVFEEFNFFKKTGEN